MVQGVNPERLLDNRSSFVAQPFVSFDAEGARVATMIAKITWRIDAAGRLQRLGLQRPVRASAVRWGDSVTSSIRYPSDRFANKLGTDVVMIADAHPPMRTAGAMEVALQVRSRAVTLRKRVRVFGTRVYLSGLRGLEPGPALPLQRTPLVYEHAYGGMFDERRYLRNPSGTGMAARVDAPAHRLECIEGEEPAGFGAIAMEWEPRASHAGTFDAEWANTRAPLPPRDFDLRHNSVAHPDLHSATPLTGGEHVTIAGATPSGQWAFALPEHAPWFELERVDGAERLDTHLDTHLDTVLIDVEPGVVEMTWRASVRVPRKCEQLRAIIVRDRNPLPEHLAPLTPLTLQTEAA